MLVEAELKIDSGDLKSLCERSPNAFNNTYFTNTALLENLEAGEFVVVQLNVNTCVFRKTGKHLVCCNRLEAFDAKTINEITEALLKQFPDSIITFEDIVFEGATALSLPNLKLSFQENWFRTISPDEKYLSKRRRSVLRRRLKKLVETLKDDDVEYVFRRTKNDDVDLVVEMNAAALEAQGRRHDFPEERRRVFRKVANEIGYSAFLYADGNLIAGDVLTIIDDKAWFNIGGYDIAYRDYSPGMQAHSMVINSCIELGVREVNFLWGNSSWKSDVGSTRIPLTTLYVALSRSTFMSPDFMRHVKAPLKQAIKMLIIGVLKKLGLKK